MKEGNYLVSRASNEGSDTTDLTDCINAFLSPPKKGKKTACLMHSVVGGGGGGGGGGGEMRREMRIFSWKFCDVNEEQGERFV